MDNFVVDFGSYGITFDSIHIPRGKALFIWDFLGFNCSDCTVCIHYLIYLDLWQVTSTKFYFWMRRKGEIGIVDKFIILEMLFQTQVHLIWP